MGTLDKSNTYNRFRGNISFFINGKTSSDSEEIPLINNENPL